MQKNENSGEVKTGLVWRQGIGACAGKPAGSLVAGDVTCWNYGKLETVTEIVAATAATVTVAVQWQSSDGTIKCGVRKMNKSKMVAISENGSVMVSDMTKQQFNLTA